MPTGQSQNFRQMCDAVLLQYPSYDVNIIKQSINDHLRNLMSRRPWSGLVQYAILQIPAYYTTGTVTATFNSQVITGVGTAWAVSDVVNTTLSITTIEPGIIDITPASMAGISTSQWLLIDGGNAGEEAVYVISVNTAEGTFRARTTLTHTSGVTITCSSLAGRQIRISINVPYITITGVSSVTRLLTQQPWPVATSATQGYSIFKAITTLGDDVKQILTMVNTQNQYQFDLDTPKTVLDWTDPNRQASSFPFRLVYSSTDPAGTPMWELYPRPISIAGYPYYYVKEWAPLSGDGDLLPNGIRSDVIVKRVRADAARWPGHKLVAGGVYFDIRVSAQLLEESERIDIPLMILEDDSTSIMSMFWQYKRYPIGGGGNFPSWDQTHDVSTGYQGW